MVDLSFLEISYSTKYKYPKYFPKLTNAAIHTKPITSWGTLVAVPANYIGFTMTLTSHFTALTTEGALRITMAGCKQSQDNTIHILKVKRSNCVWLQHSQSTYAGHHHE